MSLFSVVGLFWRGPLLLAISRKDNHEGFGLPGGKIEPGETPEKALVRECDEEVGVTLKHFGPIFDHLDRVEGNERRPCRCFAVMTWEGEPVSKEGAKVAWVHPARLLFRSCSYRDYNRALFKHLGVETLTLKWQQREHDGLWNAACACGATLAGVGEPDREEAEQRHFENTAIDRVRAGYPECGPSAEPCLGCTCPACKAAAEEFLGLEKIKEDELWAEVRKIIEAQGEDFDELMARAAKNIGDYGPNNPHPDADKIPEDFKLFGDED